MAGNLKGFEERLERRRWLVSLIFLAALVAGCFQITPPRHFGAGYEMVDIASSLVAYGSYANPFLALPTGPTAANPPAYPLFLAVLIKLLKTYASIFLAAQLGYILVNAVTAAFFPLVSYVFFGERFPGLVASALWVLAMPMMPSWDVGYTVAGILWFTVFTGLSIQKGESAPVRGLVAGILAGVLFLLNPTSLFIIAPWIVFQFLFSRNRRYVLRFGLVLAGMVFVTAFAWSWRNDRQLGAFVIRTNLGMTLYSSNNDCAESSLLANTARNCYQVHHPNTSVAEAELLRQMGEVAYDRKRIDDTKLWIRANPGSFSELTKTRFVEFWFPILDEHPVATYTIWISTVLSVPGLLFMAFRRQSVIWYILAVLAIYPLLYYIVVSDVRYRYPVLWLTLLAAGFCVKETIEFLSPRVPTLN
jgi:hypothetical protein